MKKYIVEWADGSKSAMEVTKEQVLTTLNNWYKKENHWSWLKVTNIKTGKSAVYFQENQLSNITEIEV